MAHRTAPWQNRPSMISCWEHSLSGFDITGDAIQNLNPLTTKDNLIVHYSVFGGIPICIPRACRMTRWCFEFMFFDALGDDFIPVDIEKSDDCGGSWSLEDSFTVEIDLTPITLNCACGDVSVMFEECDLWVPSFPFLDNGFTFPFFRMNFHFELR